MTAILPPERILGGTDLQVDHPAGLLRFQECRRNEWLTLKGEPAMKAHRGYWLDGDYLDAVSSIVGVLDRPGLTRWMQDHTARGAVQAERMGELQGVPEEEYLARVTLLGLGPEAARDQGAARGTAIHLAMHTLARTGEPPDSADYPREWLPWLGGSMRAWLALDPASIDAEFLVCHPELGYAGRPDLCAVCDGKRTLIDFKTGKGKVFSAGHWQTRGYAECFEFCELEPPERIVIVGIDDRGGFELVDCEVSGEEWHGLVAVYRANKRAERAMAGQRKLAKAAVRVAA